MEASDLMIGDWVEIDCKPKQISSVLETPMGGMVRCQNQSITAFVEHISPIPLTPEILEKNGFTQLEPSVNYDWWCIDNKDKFLVGFGFGKEEGRTVTGWVFDTVGLCDYKRQIGVHELQNLLRLAGIEKEIEL